MSFSGARIFGKNILSNLKHLELACSTVPSPNITWPVLLAPTLTTLRPPLRSSGGLRWPLHRFTTSRDRGLATLLAAPIRRQSRS
mgnify:FL=1